MHECGDATCPGHDGDACHYEDLPGSPAMVRPDYPWFVGGGRLHQWACPNRNDSLAQATSEQLWLLPIGECCQGPRFAPREPLDMKWWKVGEE